MKIKAGIAKEILGFCGMMISGSKSWYSDKYPKHVVVFNSNVCTKDGKIWYGDIDLTLSESKLVELAKKLKEDVYLLYEMDARFDNENNPKLENAVYKVDKNGNSSFFKYAIRNSKRGKLSGKLLLRSYEETKTL